MRKKLVNTQMGNYKTYQMYLRQMTTLAQNVFNFKNLPEFIDISYINNNLLMKGMIAFFQDEELGVLALPFITVDGLDLYGRPNTIEVIGQNGYKRTLKKDEYIIMYDNLGRYPLFMDICQYAERVAQDTRVCDINIAQQKTPRFWKTSKDKEKSVRDLVNNVDGMSETVLTYNNLITDDTTLVMSPAPYVADKLTEQKEKDWNEFLRLIGISNISFQKKERLIQDEVQISQGGTIASRFNRFIPRAKAVELINKKFGTNIEVEYYDGLPTTLEKVEESEEDSDYEESEVERDDI